MRAFGNQGLHARSLRHGPPAALEEMPDVREHRGVLAQLPAQQLRNQVPRQVIRGRPKAAGGDDEVGARQRLAHGLLDVAAGVRHRDLAGDKILKESKILSKAFCCL